MKKSITIALATTVLAGFWFTPGICSNDDLRAKGIAAYKAKKYKEAAKILEEALESGDGSPDCYAYLAGSHYGSGNYIEAVRRYIDLKNAFKGLPAGNHAEAILKRIDPQGKWAARVAEIQAKKKIKAATEKKKAEKLVEKDEPNHDDLRKAKIEAKKASVMKEASSRCKAIRARIKQQIRQAKANSNQRYRYSDGSIRTDISDEHEAAIRASGQAEINRIMDNARRKARSYR